jgi:hypothetical protein
MTVLAKSQEHLKYLEKVRNAIWVEWCFDINNSEMRKKWWAVEDSVRQVKQEIYSLTKVAK